MVDIKEVIDLINIHPLKIKNIYLYGSRVYETQHSNSDYNILVVANYMTEKFEINTGKYNIQIHTPQKFRRDLDAHDIFNLECIFAPENARLQEKINYKKKFKLNKNKFKKTIIAQANTAWINGQNNELMAKKAIFNTIKTLHFGKQVLLNGEIKDYTEANYIWNELKKCKGDIFLKYIKLKNDMEQEILKIK